MGRHVFTALVVSKMAYFEMASPGTLPALAPADGEEARKTTATMRGHGRCPPVKRGK